MFLIGPVGSKQIPTPHIDSLAQGGVKLNNYYVNPSCSPTRASLLSGRSLIHHGVYLPFSSSDDASGLNLSYTLLPEYLKQRYNYNNYMVGKWHLGFKNSAYLPTSRGFQRFFGYYSGILDYWNHYTEEGFPTKGLDIFLGGSDFGLEPGKDVSQVNTRGQYSTLLFAKQAAQWIGDHGKTSSGTPMFLYLAFQGIHSANNRFVQAPQSYIDKFLAFRRILVVSISRQIPVLAPKLLCEGRLRLLLAPWTMPSV